MKFVLFLSLISLFVGFKTRIITMFLLPDLEILLGEYISKAKQIKSYAIMMTSFFIVAKSAPT